MEDKDLNYIPEPGKNKNMGRWITGIYVLIIVTIFPLFYTDYYFNILQAKYYFFCSSTILFIVAITFYCVYKLFSKDEERNPIKKRLLSFSLPEKFIIAFLIISIISTLQSDFVYESFWGNEGRYTGLFLWIIYTLSVLMISKLFNLKKWYLDAFLFAGMLVCLFGITDYFQMDILNFKVNMNPYQKNMFVSTIGNVNTYTAYVALVLGVSTTLFALEKGIKQIVKYYICMVISLFGLIMGLSDNAYLALAALFAFLPFMLFKSRAGIKRYLVVITTFSIVIWCVDLINKAMPDKVLYMDGMLKAISGFSGLEVIVVLLCLATIAFYLLDYHRKKDDNIGRWPIYIWAAFLLISLLVVVLVLCDANLGSNPERYGKLGNYLIFNDKWGTNRGFNWRIAMESYKDFPLLHKLFGHGPDTYGVLTVTGPYYDQMRLEFNEIYDSAHNEYLQFLITVGPFGMIAYIGLLISSLIEMLKQINRNKCTAAISMAVICYAAQALVNINLPISTPVFMILLAAGLSISKSNLSNEPEYSK